MHASAGQRLVLALGLVACLLKGVFTAAVTPPFQTPDEYGHYDYVLYLSYIDWREFLMGRVARPTGYNGVATEELWAATRATGTESHLRGQGFTRPARTFTQQVDAGDGFVRVDTHAALAGITIVAPQFNYPVLYYGSASVLVRLVRLFTTNPVIAYHVVRACSLLLLAATVFLAWRTAIVMFGSHDWLPVGVTTAFVALQPQLGMLGTSVQSDMLTVTLVTWAACLAVGYDRAPRVGLAVWQGVVIGALALTKIHAAAAVAVAFTTLIAWHQFRTRGRQPFVHLVVAGSVAAVLGLWWYVRAFVLFGSTTGMVGDFRTAQFVGRRQNVRAWMAQWPYTWDTFWGVWGWAEIRMPDVVYTAIGWMSALSVVPALRPAAVRGVWRASAQGSTWYCLALVLSYAGIMAVVAATIGPIHNNQGRHWLPIVIAPALILGSIGVTTTGRWRPAGYALLAIWCVALAATNVVLLVITSRYYGG